MLTILFEDTAQVSLNFTLNGQRVQNNLFFEHVGSIDAAALDALNDDVMGWWSTEVAPLLSSSLELDNIYSVDRSLPTGAYFLTPCVALCVGGVASDPEANQVAAVVQFLTARRGRAFRGRNYVAAVPSTVTEAGLMTAAFVDNLTDAYGLLNTAVAGGDWTHVVASAAGKPESGLFTGQVEPIIAYTCSRSNGVRRSRRIQV